MKAPPQEHRRAAGGLGRRPGTACSAPTRSAWPGADVHAAQVLLSAADLQRRTHYLNARQTLRRLLAWHAVPVVNENDTTATDEITFGDNDFLAAQVAIMIEARLLVLLTDTGGTAQRRSRAGPDAELIAEVADPSELRATRSASTPRRSGSAACAARSAAAEMAGAAGIRAVICDGTAHGNPARRRRRRDVGTRFRLTSERASSFKLWLRYAKPAHGHGQRRRRRRARAARAREQPAARSASPRSRASSRPATPSRSRRPTARVIGRGSSTTRPRSCAGSRACAPSRSGS